MFAIHMQISKQFVKIKLTFSKHVILCVSFNERLKKDCTTYMVFFSQTHKRLGGGLLKNKTIAEKQSKEEALT